MHGLGGFLTSAAKSKCLFSIAILSALWNWPEKKDIWFRAIFTREMFVTSRKFGTIGSFCVRLSGDKNSRKHCRWRLRCIVESDLYYVQRNCVGHDWIEHVTQASLSVPELGPSQAFRLFLAEEVPSSFIFLVFQELCSDSCSQLCERKAPKSTKRKKTPNIAEKHCLPLLREGANFSANLTKLLLWKHLKSKFIPFCSKYISATLEVRFDLHLEVIAKL